MIAYYTSFQDCWAQTDKSVRFGCLLTWLYLLLQNKSVYLNEQVHEGEECARFPLECPQQCGMQEIPREEVQADST